MGFPADGHTISRLELELIISCKDYGDTTVGGLFTRHLRPLIFRLLAKAGQD
jgi:hypothetical protein